MAQPALRIYEMDLPLKSAEDQTFHLTLYSPNEQARLKGIVIAVHGWGENANRYRLMAKECLVPAGFSLVVPDLPGFGQTAGARGVSSFDDCLEVIDETLRLMQSQCKGIPLFLYGHSMGGSLALNYLLKREERPLEEGEAPSYAADPTLPLRAAVISSPWLELYRSPPVFLMKVFRFIGGLLPRLTVNKRLKPDELCDDLHIQQDREQDKFCHSRISFKLLSDCWQCGEKAEREAQQLHLPLLLMYGDRDQVVSTEAIERLAAQFPRYMQSVCFPGFQHEIHNMVERRQVYETLLEYLELCLQNGPKRSAEAQTAGSLASKTLPDDEHAGAPETTSESGERSAETAEDTVEETVEVVDENP